MTAISPSITKYVSKNRTAPVVAVVATARETPERPNYFAIYAWSIFAVTMLFLLGVAIPAAIVYGNAVGWGLGAFCAFWGGPGFGVMAASARLAVWEDKHSEHAE